MATQQKPTERNIDIWLILVIVLMILSLGGGLYLTGQSVLARMDMATLQLRSQLGTLESEIFELRKEVQSIDFAVRKAASAAAGAPAAVPPDAPAAAPTP